MILLIKQASKLIAGSILIITNFCCLQAAIIKGNVIDSNTHESVTNAGVFIDKNINVAVTGLSGGYIFTNLKPGNYVINAKSAGYENSIPQQLIIKSESDTIKYNIYIKPKTTSIDEVKVLGQLNKETNQSARNDERLASNVINIVSAKTIESLPDQNVADVMQRVSGISMTKNSSGGNSNMVIRGMPSRYNSTLVDGVVMPSTSSSGRSVSLEMFGSELVGRIEVVKALTPDLEGDAIGGTVNVKMKQAPDTPFIKIQAGTGYNQYYLNHDFLTFDNSTVAAKDFNERYGLNYVPKVSEFPRKNLIVDDKKAIPDMNLGISGGRRFFDNKFGIMAAASVQSSSLANTYDYTDYSADPFTNKPDPNYWEHQVYSKDQKRYGGYTKMDYQFNTRNQLSIYSSFFQINELRVREFADHQAENGGAFYRPIETQTETDNSGISCTSIKGEHKLLDNLDIDWTVLYAAANSTSPDFASIELQKSGSQPPTLNYSNPVVRNWQWDIDQNKSAYLNINYKPTLFEHLFEFKAGGMVRSKYRKNYSNNYVFEPSPDFANYTNPNLLTVPLRTLSDQQSKGNAIDNPGNYRAWENIQAVYGLVNTTFGKLQILTGARIEFSYMTNQHNQNNVQFPVTGTTLQYYDVLPSLHLTYKFTEKQNLRFAAYQAINRQGYTEVIPYSDPRAGAQSGNPKLQHAYANCLDLRYEIYPQNEEVFTAGIFYKQLNNAIEELISGGSDSKSFQNVALCTNYGLELVAMKSFGNFEISANYTSTHSAIDVPKHFNVVKKDQYNNDSVATITRTETRTLAGQSPNLINLNMSYRNAQFGFKYSIAYTMQGYNLVSPSDSYGKDIYQSNYNNLGLTFEKNFLKKLVVVVKVSNLLNSPVVRYIKDDKTIVEKSYNYQSYFIGLKLTI
jgi:hypothetical protein